MTPGPSKFDTFLIIIDEHDPILLVYKVLDLRERIIKSKGSNENY